MKKIMIVLSLTIGIGAVIALNSCKKETSAVMPDESVSAQDNATIANAMDATSDDAVSAVGQQQNMQKSAGGLNPRGFNMDAFCGLSINVTGSYPRLFITLTYDGSTNCHGVMRSGTVTIADTTGLLWQNAGATIVIAYNNLKVTDVVSGNSYTIQGSHTITKETAGLEWMVMLGLSTNTTVATRNQAGFSITWSDGQQKMWKADRTRSWSSAVSTTSGKNLITTSVYSEGPGNVDLSGINRYDQPFTESILTAIQADNNAGCMYLPYAGETQYVFGTRTTTVLYGTNPEGVKIGSSRVCGDGYYITYTNDRGSVEHRFVRYW